MEIFLFLLDFPFSFSFCLLNSTCNMYMYSWILLKTITFLGSFVVLAMQGYLIIQRIDCLKLVKLCI